MNQSLATKFLSGMANVTTIIAFGTAILGLLFPQKTADYVASFLEDVTAARVSLERIETSSEQTASATGALATALAERPRFDARSRLVQMGSVLGQSDLRLEFQMTLENLTNQPVEDLVVVIGTEEGGLVSRFRSYFIPPFEIHREIASGTAKSVCYAYSINGTFVSEYRVLEQSDGPFRDDMGNAATFVFNHLDYEFREEVDSDIFFCGKDEFSRTGLAARAAEIAKQAE